MKKTFFIIKLNTRAGVALFFLFSLLISSRLFAQTVPGIYPGTLKNGVLSTPYNMVGPWLDDFVDYHYLYSDYHSAPLDNYMNFELMFPQDYDSTVQDNKKYPMIVFLHGAGESGRGWFSIYPKNDPKYDNNSDQLLLGGKQNHDALLKDPSDPRSFNGFLFYPQCHYSGAWAGNPYDPATENELMAIKILELLINKYKIDPNRIYISGLSNGAKGVWDIMYRRPDLFAAAIILSGTNQSQLMVPALPHIPIWISQGGLDFNPAPSASITMINAFSQVGVKTMDIPPETNNLYLPNPDTTYMMNRYTLYPTIGHSVWNYTFARYDYFSFFKQYSKLSIRVFGKSAVCENDSIHIGISHGFKHYQWTLNTQLIPNSDVNDLYIKLPGDYRVRIARVVSPTEQDWSEWSQPVAIGILPKPPKPNIIIQRSGATASSIVTPTDVNRQLTGPDGYIGYKWTGTSNGSSQSIYPGTPGIYNLVVTNNNGCKSDLSTLKLILDTAPSINAASNLTATVLGIKSIQLNWTDNSSNETFFEIHRSNVNGTDQQTIYLAGANSVAFTDTTLNPHTTYYYKIRAINDAGGAGYSNIAPATTLVDSSPPTQPADFWGTINSNNQITWTWKASTDNAKVTGYNIYDSLVSPTAPITTTANLYYLQSNTLINTSYTYMVAARDLTGNISSKAKATINTFNLVQGTSYKYYEGTWSAVPNFDALNPRSTGLLNNFSITPKLISDLFGFKFEALIDITASSGAGDYTFWTSSDDGSNLYIDGIRVVNNDGLHGITNKSGQANLTVGKHSLVVTYFDRSGGEFLDVRYAKGQFTDAQYSLGTTIPDNILYTYVDGQAPTAVGDLKVDSVSDASIRLTWSVAKDNAKVSGYNLYNSADIRIGTTTGTLYTMSGLNPLTLYTYKVSALDATGNESIKKDVSATTLARRIPRPPQILFAVATGPHAIKLTWQDNSDNETKFYIERSISVTGPFVRILQISPNATSYTDKGPSFPMNSLTTYFYRMQASNDNLTGGGSSAYSNILSARTKPDIPADPSNLAVHVINNKDFSITWTDNSTNENGFVIYMSNVSGTQYELLDSIPLNGTSFTVTGPEKGTAYFYIIRAYNQDGHSAFSNEANGLIPGPANIYTGDWKLRAINAIDSWNNYSLDTCLIRGSDFIQPLTLNPGSAAKRSITFKLPAMPYDGMFIYSFNDPAQTDLTITDTYLVVNIYYSGNSTNGTDGTWNQLPAQFIDPQIKNLQKINISKTYAGKWMKIELINNNSINIYISDIGLYSLIPNVNLPYFIVMGASLMDNSGTNGEWQQSIKNSFPGKNYEPVIFNFARSGIEIRQTRELLDSMMLKHPFARYVLLHTGGNNVTAQRPARFNDYYSDDYYRSIKILFDQEYRQIIKDVYTNGKIPVVASLTFRDYKSTNTLVLNQPVNQGNNPERGSLPYNFAAYDLMKELNPEFWNSYERKPFVDLYALTFNNQGLLGADGIHLTDYSLFRQFWIDNALKYLFRGERNPYDACQVINTSLDSSAFALVDHAVQTGLSEDAWKARILVEQMNDHYARLSLLDRLDSLLSPITYYPTGPGSHNDIRTWTSNPNGSGQNPQNFSYNRQQFTITNTVTLNSNMIITGYDAKIKVMPGGNLIIPSNDTLTALIDLDSGAVLTLAGSSINGSYKFPVFNKINKYSTIIFDNNELYYQANYLPYGTYGNLILKNGNKFFQSSINGQYFITGDLTIDHADIQGYSINATGTGVSTVTLYGNLNVINNGHTFCYPQNNYWNRQLKIIISDASKIHQLTAGYSDLRFYSLNLDNGVGVKLVNPKGTMTLTVGTDKSPGDFNGTGSLSLSDNSILDIGNDTLKIAGGAVYNSNNSKGVIKSAGGSIIFQSTLAKDSYLNFDKNYDTLNYLEIRKDPLFAGGKVILNDTVNIRGRVKVEDGNYLKTNALIVLLSDTSGTAGVSKMGTGATLQGKIRMQRMIYSTTSSSFYIGTPIKSQTLATWDNFFEVDGVTGSNPSAWNNVRNYSESAYATGTTGWLNTDSIRQAIIPGMGYSAYLYSNYFIGPAKTLNVMTTGLPVIGSGDDNRNDANEMFDFGVTYTTSGSKTSDFRGWNLIANPYPDKIDWNNSAAWVKTNMDGSFWIWNSKKTGVAGYITVAGDGTAIGAPPGWDKKIESGQGFFVKANGINPVLKVSEAAKSETVQNSFLRIAQDVPSYELTLQLKNEANGYADVTMIRFLDSASFSYDNKFDARKITEYHVSISSMTDDSLDLAINALPVISTDRDVILNINTDTTGTFDLIPSGLASFLPGTQLFLIDKYLHSTTPFIDEGKYRFNITTDPESKGVNRFELTFRTPVILNIPDYGLARVNDSIFIPVTSKNFINIDSLKLSMEYNAANLQFIRTDSLFNGLISPSDFELSGTRNGIIVLNSGTNNANGVTVKDGETLFGIWFKILGPPGVITEISLDESPALLRIIDHNQVVRPVTTTVGSVNIPQYAFYTGSVTNLLGDPITGAVIRSPEMDTLAAVTDSYGKYSTSLPLGFSVNLMADSVVESDPVHGITILDLLLLEKELNLNGIISDPKETYICDFDNSGTVTQQDLDTIQSIILFGQKKYHEKNLWQFITKDSDLNNYLKDSTLIKHSISIDESGKHDSLDFIGIKKGDINFSAFKKTDDSAVEPLNFNMKSIDADSDVISSVYAINAKNVIGFQFTISWDTAAFELKDIIKPIDFLIINRSYSPEGLATVIWNPEGKTSIPENSKIMDLVFSIKNQNLIESKIKINSDLTEAIYADNNYNEYSIPECDVVTKLNPSGNNTGPWKIVSSYPNPFNDKINFTIYSEESDKIRILIYTINGNLLYSGDFDIKDGNNEISLSNQDFNRKRIETGVFIYKISNVHHTEFGRIIHREGAVDQSKLF